MVVTVRWFFHNLLKYIRLCRSISVQKQRPKSEKVKEESHLKTNSLGLVNKTCQYVDWTASFQDHIYLLRFRLTSWLFCTKVTINCTIYKEKNTIVSHWLFLSWTPRYLTAEDFKNKIYINSITLILCSNSHIELFRKFKNHGRIENTAGNI